MIPGITAIWRCRDRYAPVRESFVYCSVYIIAAVIGSNDTLLKDTGVSVFLSTQDLDDELIDLSYAESETTV